MLIGFSWTRATIVRPTLALRSVGSDTLEFDAGAAGILYWLANDMPTRSDAQIKAGGAVSGSLMVSEGAASVVLDLRPLGGGTRYFHAVLEVAGVFSDVVAEQIVLPATLGGATFANVTATAATLSVTTDCAEGALFVAVHPSGATPGAADIKSGLGAVFAASLAAPGVGKKDFLASGLTGGTAYQAFFVQNNGTDSAVLATAEFRTVASATTINEVLFDETTSLDLSANGVPLQADAFTLALRCRVKSAGGNVYFIGNGFDSYIRLNSSGSVRIRIESISGAALIDYGPPGPYAPENEVSVLLSVDRTRAQWAADGTAGAEASYADAGSQIVLPRWLNGNTNAAPNNRITITGLWIATGRLDPAATYSAFFKADGTPTAAMLAGNPIAGLAPVFAESGSATNWNARPGMTGAAQDV